MDSDVAKKIVQYDLLSELTKGLSCKLSDLAVLPQLKFQLKLNKPDKALKKLGSEKAVKAAKALVDAASEVEIDCQDSELLLMDSPSIDTGESVLFAAIAQRSQDKLISGDKRAFYALAQLEAPAIIKTLWPRIMCLEQAVAAILKSHPFESISQKIRARPDVDAALHMIFGHSQASSVGGVEEGLASYINALIRDTNGVFCSNLVTSSPIAEHLGLEISGR